MQRCELCKYYDAEFARCRRYPPIFSTGNRWSKVMVMDWCGEYKSAKAATKAEGFIHPSLREIRDYSTEIDSGVNPVEFFNHYESTGWMKGKSKMKDWKAAFRGWTAREGK